MPLTKKHLAVVCLATTSSADRCRYCAVDDADYTKHYCLKKSSKRAEIDTEVEEFIREAKKKGRDPRKDNVPLGDNCPGYPILRHIEQGIT